MIRADLKANRTMDGGFNVNTSALYETSAKYFAISSSCLHNIDTLKRLRNQLASQVIDVRFIEILDTQIKQLNSILEDIRNFGNQCREVSETYQDTERAVARLVDNLPVVMPFAFAPQKQAAQPKPVQYNFLQNEPKSEPKNEPESESESESEDDEPNNEKKNETLSETKIKTARITSNYTPAPVLLATSNRLPSENWLIALALAYHAKKLSV